MGRNAFFNFKKFGVQFSKSVFPVGTDSCLLGAWMCAHFPKNIHKPATLDIGCGTGILGLFAATELEAQVTAIDIQQGAVDQCLANAKTNGLESSVQVQLSDISTFTSDLLFDIIVCNPPYFPDLHKGVTEREIARQKGSHFHVGNFLEKASYLLQPKGKIFLVIPYDQLDDYLVSATQNQLFLAHLALVKGNQQSEIKRALLCLEKAEPHYFKQEIIVVEKERNVYTAKANSLLHPFYLNL